MEATTRMDPGCTAVVEDRADRLRSESLAAIERAVSHKRLAWMPEDGPEVSERPKTPRAAFELFAFDHLGLDPKDVQVVSESDGEIVWLSNNRCETLYACIALGLDTRTVCGAAYEKPTQVLRV